MLGHEDSDVAAAAIADEFMVGAPIKLARAGQGAMGRIWHLDTTAGAFAIKESLRQAEPRAFEAQLAFSAAFCDAAGHEGVSAPHALRSRSGDYLMLTPTPTGQLTLVRAATWIEGRPSIPATDAAAAATWLGSTIAILEAIPDPISLPPPDPWLGNWFTTAPSSAQWDDLIDQARQARLGWADLLARAAPILVDLSALVGPPPAEQLSVSHVDLQQGNVLVTTTGFALLDWDDVAPVSRDRVLARALADWHLHDDTIDETSVRCTMTAYRERGGTAELTDLTVFGDLAAGYLNYLHEQVTRALTEHTEQDVNANAEPIDRLLDQPTDIGTLTSLLLAATST